MANNGVFINHYSSKMVHIQKSTNKDGSERQFANVSFACPESASGYATFSVNLGQLFPAKKKDGTVVQERYNILVGNANKEKTVSILNTDGNYSNIKLSCNKIAEYVNTARNDYSASQTA